MHPIRSPRPVIVKTPLSRRRVLAVTGGAAAVVGTLKFATWASRRVDEPTRLPAVAPTLAVAIPTGGDARERFANLPLLTAVRRVLGDVEQAARGRFRLVVEEIGMPTAPSPPARAISQIVVLGPLMASGAPPELLTLTSRTSPAALPDELMPVSDNNALVPLDDLLKANPVLRLGDFYAPALDVCRTRGKLLAVPLTALPMLFVYDEQRFASAAVAPPDASWGWTQLLDAARRLTVDPPGSGAVDQYGLIPPWPIGSLLALIWQNGGDVTDAARSRALLTDARAREAIEFFASFYADRPASPADPFAAWTWGADGMRINGRWWAAMAHVTSAGGSAPPVFGPTVGPTPPTPVGYAPLPAGRRRATAMSVTSTLSMTHQTKDRDLAGTALALLAEHVSSVIVPSTRRLGADAIQRLAPHFPPEQAQLLASALADSRTMVAGDYSRTSQVFGVLWNGLIEPLQRRARPLDELIESANRAVQTVLDRP